VAAFQAALATNRYRMRGSHVKGLKRPRGRLWVATMAVLYSAGERFDQACGETRRKFIAWESGTQGPRRVSRKEIDIAFAEGWVVEIIAPSNFEVQPDMKDFTFSEGGPKAWFVVASRGNFPKDN
jgi:hypothetical protein